jgi:cell division septum initiation protein DivIVA
VESSVDGLLGDVSGEAPRRRFAVVMRGYDRYQVDDHFKQTGHAMRQACEQVQALKQELAEAHRQLREQERPTLAGLGSRIERLLCLAEERAAEIVGDACSVANELQAAAQMDAAELRAAAEKKGREAEQHSKQLVSNAKKNADQIVAQAQAQADQLMADTKSEIDRHRAAAQREVDHLTRRKDSITGHLDQLRELLGTQIGPADGPPAETTEPGEIT